MLKIARRLKKRGIYNRKFMEEIVKVYRGIRDNETKRHFLNVFSSRIGERAFAAFWFGTDKVNNVAIISLKILARDVSPEVRAEALEAIANLKDRRFLPEVLNALKDKSSRVKIAAIEAIRGMNIKSAAAINGLIKLLKDRNPDVKKAAIFALEVLKVKRAKNYLQELLLKDRDESVRASAIFALTELGIADEKVLIKCLKDRNSEVRFLAAHGLSSFKKGKNVEILLERLKIEESKKVRDGIIVAIGSLGMKESLDALLKILNRIKSKEVLGNALVEFAKNFSSGKEGVIERIMFRLSDLDVFKTGLVLAGISIGIFPANKINILKKLSEKELIKMLREKLK